MIYKMDMDMKHGKMEAATKDIMKRGKNMEQGFIIGWMEADILENGNIQKSMVTVSIFGMMEG